MIVLYDSLTGNCKRFAEKLSRKSKPVSEYNSGMGDFLLITHTIGFGQVPRATTKLLDALGSNCIGVCVSGNRNWGDNFAKAGDLIFERYGIPTICRFELQGMTEDIEFVKGEMRKYEKMD